MSSGYEKFLGSDAYREIKASSMVGAKKEWARLPVGFRRFLCRQAGLPVDLAEKPLSEIDIYDAEALYHANKALKALAESAHGPLIVAAINKPRPRDRKFRP